MFISLLTFSGAVVGLLFTVFAIFLNPLGYFSPFSCNRFLVSIWYNFLMFASLNMNFFCIKFQDFIEFSTSCISFFILYLYFLFSIIFSTSSFGILLPSILFELYINLFGNSKSNHHQKVIICFIISSPYE